MNFIVPRKIMLMSKYIWKKLREDPLENVIEVNVPASHLKLIVDYCISFDYLKVKSTIKFPAESNIFE